MFQWGALCASASRTDNNGRRGPRSDTQGSITGSFQGLFIGVRCNLCASVAEHTFCSSPSKLVSGLCARAPLGKTRTYMYRAQLI